MRDPCVASVARGGCATYINVKQLTIHNGKGGILGGAGGQMGRRKEKGTGGRRRHGLGMCEAEQGKAIDDRQRVR